MRWGSSDDSFKVIKGSSDGLWEQMKGLNAELSECFHDKEKDKRNYNDLEDDSK